MDKPLDYFLRSIAAGASIGIGGIAYLLLGFALSSFEGSLWKIFPSLLFSIGLLLVCFLRFNLCTGKIGFLLNPLLMNRDKKGFENNLVGLLLMIVGNLIGAIGVGLLFGLIAMAFPDLQAYVHSIAIGKIIASEKGGYLTCFLLSIGCGALVYLAVYLFRLFKNKALKAIGIILPIALFVFLGFHHCIANAFYFAASLEFSYKMVPFFLVCLLGNFLSAIIIDLLFFGLGKIKPLSIFSRPL